jgi:hypothetical protein
MKFRAEMDIEVTDHDADVMALFPEAIQQRFDGTAIRVSRILVTKERPQSDLSKIILETRVQAEEILLRLRELILTNKQASVSDLCNLIDIPGEFTDDKWVWVDLRSAYVRQVHGGYSLILPKTQPRLDFDGMSTHISRILVDKKD